MNQSDQTTLHGEAGQPGDPCAVSLPRSAAFELSSQCNLRCRMCSHPTHPRPPAHMRVEEFKTILGKLRDLPIENIFFNMGEPLMNKSLFMFTAHARRLGLRVFISTNGQLLTQSAAAHLLQTGVALVKFSVEGTTPERYAAIRAGGDFHLLFRNMAYFKTLRDSLHSPARIRVSTILQKDNQDIAGFVKLWGPLCDEIETTSISNHINRAANAPWALAPRWKPRAACPMLSPPMQLNILANGDAVICCIDFHAQKVLGNLLRDSFETVWNSETAREIREKSRQNALHELAPCNACAVCDYGDILRPGGGNLQDEVNIIHQMVKNRMTETLAHIETETDPTARCPRCGKPLRIRFAGMCLACLEHSVQPAPPPNHAPLL